MPPRKKKAKAKGKSSKAKGRTAKRKDKPPKKKDKPPKKTAKAKGGSKRRRSSKASKQKASKAGKTKRVASAYMIYCIANRADVVRQHGIQGFAEIAKVLAESWHSLAQNDRAQYETCVTLDKHRSLLQKLSAGEARTARSDESFEEVSSAIKNALHALGRAPSPACIAGIALAVVSALEDLEAHMFSGVRNALAAALGPVARSPSVMAAFRRALGMELGDRVVALLQRWAGSGGGNLAKAAAPAESSVQPTDRETENQSQRAPRRQATSREPTDRETENQSQRAPRQQATSRESTVTAKSAASSAIVGAIVATDQGTRGKVVGLLMRAFAKGDGRAAVSRSKAIEHELFEAYGSDSKEYKGRSRSVVFNLGASDGALLKRVLADEITPKDLVHLKPEDLASDTLKAERREERERYFRTELHVSAGPKRKRDLYNAPQSLSKKAENADDGDVEAEDALENTAATEEPGEDPFVAVGWFGGSSSLPDDVNDGEASQESASSSDESGNSSDSGDSSSSSSGSNDAADNIPVRISAAQSDEPQLPLASSSSSSSSSSDSASPNAPTETSPAARREVGVDSPAQTQLIAMGFDRAAVDFVLKRAKGKVEVAAALLCAKGGNTASML